MYSTPRTDVRPPARDGSPAPHQARIAVDRRDADESCELVAADGAEFRKLSQKRARGDVADARGDCQEFRVRAAG
jgi:hypothetical protein